MLARIRLRAALFGAVVSTMALGAAPATAAAELRVSATFFALECGGQAIVNFQSSGFPVGTVRTGVILDNGAGYYTAAGGFVNESGEFGGGFGSSAGFPDGTYELTVFVDEDSDLQPDPGSPTATTTFVVDVCQPAVPTTKEECKKGTYEQFVEATNQGDCVSYVSTNGRNELGKNIPGQ